MTEHALHHRRTGHGTPVVLLHGWPQTSYAWRDVVPALALRHEVHTLDLPGLGDSGLAPGHHDVRSAAAVLDAWRESAGLPSVHVVGHDLGAAVAYAWAATAREHVRSLTVLAVPLHGFGLEETIRRAGLWHFGLFAVPGLAETLAAGRERVLLEYFLGRTKVPGAIGAADIDEYLRSYSQPDRLAAGFEYYRAVGADTAAFTEYGRTPLAAPALALGAGNGAPVDSLRRVAAHVRGEVLDSGHYLPEERPADVAALIAAFLAACDDGR